MTNRFRTMLLAGLLMATALGVAHGQAAGTRWRLRIENLKRDIKVDATIRFTGATATESCLGDTWKRVVVEATAVRDDVFFPLAEPLAHGMEHGDVILGRTATCDNYLLLSGKPAKRKIGGDYYSGGLGGSRKLGEFSLERIE